MKRVCGSQLTFGENLLSFDSDISDLCNMFSENQLNFLSKLSVVYIRFCVNCETRYTFT